VEITIVADPGRVAGSPPAEHNGRVLTHERVKTHWWRVALVVPAVVVAAFSPSVFSGAFGVVPILIWCSLAPSRRTGLIVGSVLLVLLAWFVVPRALNLAGPWPAGREIFWLHPALAAVVCAIGARRGAARLTTLVCAGFLVTGAAWVVGLEAAAGDEGVSPGPAQLQIQEDHDCGSGGCWRVMTATGDRAPDVMREHLAAANFTASPDPEHTELCRTNGLVVTHEVCARLRTLSPDAVRVEWYVN
jgi:hypothetical protein